MLEMKTGEPVAAARCNSYDNCAGAVFRALELSGLLADLRGRRVLLKLNMMKGTPETAEATDARFAGALVRVLKGEGCAVSAGDSSGILGFTSEVFEASGMTAEVTANGGTMVNFDAGPFVDIDLGGVFAGRRLPVARALLEADAVLDVPKMKTHTFLGLTLAVKNLVGVFPGAVKCGLHTLAPDRDDFAGLVAGIPAALESAGVNIAGAIVDGILALGGRGGVVRPAPTWMNFTAAGRNLFDVDMFCAALAGFDPSEVPLCRIGARDGLGAAGVAGLVVVGDPIEPVPIPHPGLDFQEAAPPVTAAYYKVRGSLVRPTHDPAKCSGCDKCVQVCPVGCILVRGPSERVITGECNRCLACREVCPTGAMGLVANPVLKPLLKRRARGLRMDRLR
jgi:uncharacterized protein (DUF362 family)/ferredoxin